MTYNLKSNFTRLALRLGQSTLVYFYVYLSFCRPVAFSQSLPRELVIRQTEEQVIVSMLAKRANSFSVFSYTTHLQFKGYLYARHDSTQTILDTLVYYFNKGTYYKTNRLRIRSTLHENSQGGKLLNKNLELKELKRTQKQIIDQAENNGYPFAHIKLDSIEMGDSVVFADLVFDPGPLFLFDTLDLQGDVRIKPSFLSRFLFLKPGERYSERKVKNAEIYIKELSFLQAGKSDLLFNEGKAKLILPLKARKANIADGVLGLMNNSNGANKLLITGELNVNLNNLLQTGKRLHLHYRRFNIEAQTIEFNYYHPVLVGPVDLKLDFSLLRQDTSFLNVSRQISLLVKNAKTRLGVFSGLKTSRRLSNSFSRQNLSFDHYFYGFTYEWKNLDDFFSPRKGLNVSTRFSAGNKIINEDISRDEGFKNNSQFSVDLKIENYFSRRRSTLYSSCALGKIHNANNTFFLGDYYRIGGLRTLRGFNENYFFASSYIVSNIEYRIYTEESSYIFLFYDQGIVDNRLNIDYPMGAGPGISFKSNAGMFNFVLALGRSDDQNFRFNLAKFHFGYFSRF